MQSCLFRLRFRIQVIESKWKLFWKKRKNKYWHLVSFCFRKLRSIIVSRFENSGTKLKNRWTRFEKHSWSRKNYQIRLRENDFGFANQTSELGANFNKTKSTLWWAQPIQLSTDQKTKIFHSNPFGRLKKLLFKKREQRSATVLMMIVSQSKINFCLTAYNFDVSKTFSISSHSNIIVVVIAIFDMNDIFYMSQRICH